jgi:NADPH:quinone reductase-like Zn-dependent oxidoreductase/heme-degrading monooxygenase HmoA
MDANSGAVVLINLFEVPAGADEQFVAAWERARDFLAAQDGYRSTELHQSLGPDVEFRFVNVAEWASAAAFQAATAQPDFPGREVPFPAHPALYQVVAEDPPPTGDPGGVVLVNAFEVPPDGEGAFLGAWEQTRRFLRDQPGYLATRLHRSLSPGVDFRFVNVGATRAPRRSRPPSASPGSGRRPRPSSTGPMLACTGSCAAEVGEAEEERMKAIVQDRYGGPDVLNFKEIDRPAPKANEVLIQVHAAGLHRGDWHVMTGLPYMIRLVVPTLGLRKPKVPVLGMDVAGRVEAVGAQVTRFRPGDEVFGWTDGSFAEYATAPEDHLAAKPATLSFEEAAVVPISGFAALQGVRDVGEVQADQKVLVIGAAGAVGWFAVQLAKALGAQVTGVASTTQLELVRSIGADDVIDYTRQDVTDGTRQWDVIVDTAGRRTLSQLRRALTPTGTLVIVGGEGGGRWMGGFLRNLRAPLVSRFVGQRLRMLTSKPRQADLQVLREFLEAGKLRPLIGRTYPLGEAPEAMRAMEAGNTRGKIVITV